MNKAPIQVQIIDDEIVMLMAVSRAYRNKPVDIIAATDIDQALEQMNIFNFSLFLLDLDMKDCCGFHLLEIITKRFPKTPIILMTTADTQSIALIDKIEKIRSQYCWHIVEKPFDYKKMIGFIDRALHESEVEALGVCQKENSEYAEQRRCRRFSRFERINIARPVTTGTSCSPLAFFATLTDISVAGLGVATGNALVSGEAVRFDEKFMHQSGTVVWCRLQEDQIYKSGIRFA
ncbi:MAG: response regulator [Desulfuromusa sp.]|nr:response regulator [Desulfuromusa sp.]